MKASWTRPPPVVFVGGSEEFLRDREVRKAKAAAYSTGRRVVLVESAREIEDELNVSQTFGELLLLVYYDQGKSPPESVVSGMTGTGACLLVILDGDSVPDWVDKQTLRLVFSLAMTRKERREAAARFVVNEAKTLGTPLADSKLADALVDAVGDDLGMLSFEIAKAGALARNKQLNQISLDLLKSTLRPSAGTDLAPLMENLAYKDIAGVSRALLRIRATVADDPSMLLLRSKGGPAIEVLVWLKLSCLLEEGLSDEEAAQRSGLPLWLARKTALPAARKWGRKGLQGLVRRLAEIERGILAGIVPAPWTACEAVLIGACL